VELRDPGAIIYTSGTTGQSKGVQMSQGNLAYVAKTNTVHMGLGADDVAHISAPLYHVTGINGISHTVWAGCSTVFERRFSVTAILSRLRRHRVTAMTVVGPMLQMFWNRPWSAEEKNLSLRLIYAGSALPAPFELLRQRYGIEYLCCAYGQSEVQTSIVGRLPGLPPGAVGKPMPTLEMRLVDDSGRDVAPGDAGELIVRSKVRYAIFDGYYNNPDASERSVVDGWYYSGDVLRQDEEGYCYLVDRKKDVVRRRGENISSIELETAISSHQDIAEVAIHSVPSELGEDEVKATVVLRAGSTLGHRELHEHCSSVLPRFAVPRYVEFLDELPKNPLGRIQKFVLRERGVTPDTWDQQTDDRGNG
jgi:crotonobetaine/carnitine-CoA ligase